METHAASSGVYACNKEPTVNFLVRDRRKIALWTALAATAALGLKTWPAIEDVVHPKSKIVAGAPGQVEGHHTKQVCTFPLVPAPICARYKDEFFLEIEQCPEDVEAAQQGRLLQSFDPRVNEVRPGCIEDEVKVNQDTWVSYNAGFVAILPGSPQYRLPK
jgi:hypothetical protein